MDSSESRRIIFLDYMRVFAFLSVLIGHKFMPQINSIVSNDNYHATIRLMAEITQKLCAGGATGVVVFFLTSGYVIAHVLQRENAYEFIIKRIFRIYPLYVLAIMLEMSLGYFFSAEPLTPPHILIPRLLLLGDFFGIESALGGVEWTLRLEIVFYALMAILKYSGAFKYQQFLPILFVAISIMLFNLQPIPVVRWGYGYFSIYFPMLLIGSCIYLFFSGRSRPAISITSSIALFLISLSMLSSIQPSWKSLNFGLFAIMIFASGLALNSRMLESRILTTLSSLTYSIYLTHNWLLPHISTFLTFIGLSGTSATILSLAILFLTASILNKSIEKTGITFGNKLAAKLNSKVMPIPV